MHTAPKLSADEVARVRQQVELHMTDYAAAESAFLAAYPTYQADTLNNLREREYQRLDAQGHVYLDYTGGGLYGASQLQAHMALLSEGVFGNPHSSNPTSMAMTELDEAARDKVFSYFNADRDEYEVIFTSNASAALRIVGESYPFETDGQYVLAFDNHNSVNGIREFARSKHAPITYVPVLPPDLRLDADAMRAALDKPISGGNNLLAFPAQSNFSGVQHDLSWIEYAHERGWDVLVDCAAFAPTNRLDINALQPDFVPLSFYKMFGYPTGIGALIVRRSMLEKLRKPWFAGGTITIATVQADKHYLEDGFAAFEDGTIDYLNLPAVKTGLEHIETVGIDTIHERVVALTAYLLDELSALKHDNGEALVRIYGPLTTEQRGGTLALNLYDPNGVIFDYRQIEATANEVNISIRTGCFCNPGAGEVAMQIYAEELREQLDATDRMTFQDLLIAMTEDGSHDTVGAVRVSVGLATSFRDVYFFVSFAKAFLNQTSSGIQS